MYNFILFQSNYYRESDSYGAYLNKLSPARHVGEYVSSLAFEPRHEKTG